MIGSCMFLGKSRHESDIRLLVERVHGGLVIGALQIHEVSVFWFKYMSLDHATKELAFYI